jgi:transcriptional repressor NrdR
VVKGDKTRQPFDEAKLRAGMAGALHKRPVSGEAIDEAVSRIQHKIRGLGEREVQSRVIGEMVMDELRHLDEVAFVRFASVYRQFADVDAFHKEIEKLREHPKRRKTGRDRDRDRIEEREQLPLLPDTEKKP